MKNKTRHFIRLPKFISRLPFRKRITISLLIFALILTLYMGISSFQLSSNVIFEASKKLSENNFTIWYKSLDDYFSNVEKYSTLLIRMQSLQTLLEQKSFVENSENQPSNSIDKSIREIINLASSSDNININTLCIYGKNGYNHNYFINEELPYNNYESCIKYYTDNGFIGTGYKPSTWCNLIDTVGVYGEKSYSFINIRILYDSATLQEIGVLVIGVNVNDLYNIHSNFSDESFLIHKNGTVISHKNKSLIGTSFKDNNIYKKIIGDKNFTDTISINDGLDTRLYTYRKLSNDTYFVVHFNYYSGNEVLETTSFYITIIILIIIGFIVSAFIAVIISKSLSSSVLTLKNTVQAVYDGNLNIRFKSNNNDEITYLGQKFNEMLDQINNLFETQKKQENTNKTLELKLMQSQINPHLLYNTLDSTLWILDNNNISQAKDLIISLSNFFRITLSSGNELITLRKELELVHNYINIQRIARGKDITLDIIGPTELLDISFIKLSIQPIVENAILHAFSGYRDDGKITIEFKSQDNKTVHITIKDNGIGILKQELENINNLLNSNIIETTIRHFGLYNVQRRIKNTFGNDYGIYLESEVGDFTCVYMKIPLILHNGENKNV